MLREEVIMVKGFGRTILWLLLFVAMLGFPTIEAKYNDGLVVSLHGGGEKLLSKGRNDNE